MVFHDYNDNRMQSETKKRPLHWEDHKDTDPNYPLLHEIHEGKGIGQVRTIEQFQKHFGVNFKERKVEYWAEQGQTFEMYENDVIAGISFFNFEVLLDTEAIENKEYKMNNGNEH